MAQLASLRAPYVQPVPRRMLLSEAKRIKMAVASNPAS